jgi:hypothetical protein
MKQSMVMYLCGLASPIKFYGLASPAIFCGLASLARFSSSTFHMCVKSFVKIDNQQKYAP